MNFVAAQEKLSAHSVSLPAVHIELPSLVAAYPYDRMGLIARDVQPVVILMNRLSEHVMHVVLVVLL